MKILTQTQTGQTSGLYLELFAGMFQTFDSSYYTFFPDTSFGLRISINNQSSIPLYANYMTDIETGKCTNIGLRKTIAETLPVPFSDCIDVTKGGFDTRIYNEFSKKNKNYEQTVCVDICKQVSININSFENF